MVMLPVGQDCRYYFIFIQIINTTRLQFNLTDNPVGRGAALPNEISQCNWHNICVMKNCHCTFGKLNYCLYYLLKLLCTFVSLERASVISLFNTNIRWRNKVLLSSSKCLKHFPNDASPKTGLPGVAIIATLPNRLTLALNTGHTQYVLRSAVVKRVSWVVLLLVVKVLSFSTPVFLHSASLIRFLQLRGNVPPNSRSLLGCSWKSGRNCRRL